MTYTALVILLVIFTSTTYEDFLVSERRRLVLAEGRRSFEKHHSDGKMVGFSLKPRVPSCPLRYVSTVWFHFSLLEIKRATICFTFSFPTRWFAGGEKQKRFEFRVSVNQEHLQQAVFQLQDQKSM